MKCNNNATNGKPVIWNLRQVIIVKENITQHLLASKKLIKMLFKEGWVGQLSPSLQV